MERITVESINAKLILVCVIGLGLSVYAYNVETKLEVDNNYQPLCDISEHMKCSKAFSSEYGKGFGYFSEDSIFYRPNSFFGIIHYCIAIALSMINTKFVTKVLLFLAVLANFSSLYFAYILYFILYDFCLVCVSIYVVNFAMLIYSYNKHKLIHSCKNKRD